MDKQSKLNANLYTFNKQKAVHMLMTVQYIAVLYTLT